MGMCQPSCYCKLGQQRGRTVIDQLESQSKMVVIFYLNKSQEYYIMGYHELLWVILVHYGSLWIIFSIFRKKTYPKHAHVEICQTKIFIRNCVVTINKLLSHL